MNYVILYNDNLIRKYYGIYWVNITNLEEYINRVVNIVSLDSLTCCPYNYYKVFKNACFSSSVFFGKFQNTLYSVVLSPTKPNRPSFHMRPIKNPIIHPGPPAVA